MNIAMPRVVRLSGCGRCGPPVCLSGPRMNFFNVDGVTYRDAPSQEGRLGDGVRSVERILGQPERSSAPLRNLSCKLYQSEWLARFATAA